MFRGLINDAKAAAGSLVGKYLVRASVAVPFIVAIGFAVAAITLMLVDRFGAINAYLMVAGGFTLIGLIAALVVTVKEQEEEVAESQGRDGRYRVGRHRCCGAGGGAGAAGPARRAVRDPGGAGRARGRRQDAGAQHPAGGSAGADRHAVLADRASRRTRRTPKTTTSGSGKPNGAYAPVPNGLHREAA